MKAVLKKIEGNNLIVKENIISTDSKLTDKAKNVLFTVKITDKTEIQYTNQTYPISDKLTVNDIQLGENIIIETQEDLRTLQNNSFEASKIILPQIQGDIKGNIENINGDIILMKPYIDYNVLPPEMVETEKKKDTKYLIKITENTEIVKNSSDGGSIKQIKLVKSDLKVGMDISVFSDIDIKTNQELQTSKILIIR